MLIQLTVPIESSPGFLGCQVPCCTTRRTPDAGDATVAWLQAGIVPSSNS
jgi:hypothetical protein